jgi:WD40 repeat protein/serine/threonine protein kinase
MDYEAILEKAIFCEALELEPQEREAFLIVACRGDENLRRKLEELLAASDSASRLEKPATAAENDDSRTDVIEAVGSMIGRYRLLEKIGEGGFGEVWMAEQQEPVRRRVALKLIKLGMDTREVVARFDAERQALALMDHPCIARILDGGATVEGRPYFVMELVRGRPITTYCDEHGLDLRERLELFIQICEAVQHAHQKGIIHRDIKFTNILVIEEGGKAVPKVIDFGVARAFAQPLTEKTLFTRLGQIIGTPTYMSPEQAGLGGLDIDTRTDIYSLGVLLYELAMGRTPFEPNALANPSLELILKTIRDAEPLRPSTRLGKLNAADVREVAFKRKADPQKLGRLLRGDLDWIVMKALEKDRSRRYQTANGLALDLRRHLNNETVVARPPSTAYRFHRAWRRNRLVFTASATVLAALLAGLGVSAWQAFTAKKAQRVAQRNLYIANMKLTQQAWEQANVLPARHLLEETAEYPERGFEWYYWQRQLHQDLRTFRGHSDMIYALAFAPDGRRLASASEDHTAKVWDCANGTLLLSLSADQGAVNAVAFSPSGKWIVTAGSDHTAKVWDCTNGTNLLTLRGHTAGIWSVSIFPDGQRIATASDDRTAKTWNAANGTELRTFRGHSSYVLSLAVSADGRRIVTGSADRTAKVWDADTANELLNLAGHESNVNSVGFLPDDRRIVTVSYDKMVRIWDAVNGTNLFTLKGHTGGLWCVAAFPDARRVVSGGEDHTAKVWDVLGGTELWTVIGHVGRIRSVAVSAEGERIATGGWDGTIKLWPAEREAESALQNRENSLIHGIAVSGDGQRLVTTHGDAPARGEHDHDAILWDSSTGKPLLRFAGHSGLVWSAAFSADAKRVVTASWDKTAIVWDTANAVKIATCQGHTGQVWSASFSPGGERVLTGSADGTAKVWDAKNGKALLTLAGHTSDVMSAAYSKAGLRIVTGSLDKTARVWDVATGKSLFSLMGHGGWVLATNFSPDDRRIVTASSDARVRVWDASNGRLLATLEGHIEAVWAAVFSPDGQRIVTGSDDRTVKLWETVSGKELLTLKGHSGWVRAVAFAPDGNRIYSTSGVETRVWKAASAEEVSVWHNAQPPSPEDRVTPSDSGSVNK